MDAADPLPPAIVISRDPDRLAREVDLGDCVAIEMTLTRPDRIGEVLEVSSAAIVVVDLAMGRTETIDVIRTVVNFRRPVAVVGLTRSPLDEAVLSRALAAGAVSCVTPRTIAEHGAVPFLITANGGAFLPDVEVREMLMVEADDDLTSTERESRLRNLVLGLIPLTGGLAALISLLWRRYLGQIGVRPVDLAVDPATRIADVFFTISVLVGLIGPLVFVGSWLDLLVRSTGDRLGAWILRHRQLSRLFLSLVTVAATITLANLGQLLFALFVGPFVAALLLAKIFDLDDDLPAALRITRLRASRAAAGAGVLFVLLLALLSYEVIIRGPAFDAEGEAGWMAPTVLGFNAEPVEVTLVEDGSVSQLLYLGGNADLYVFVDPCDDDRVDLVSVGATRITVIDRVACDGP